MTQPRLRSTVTYLPTSSGMLFRNGDAFLPVNGAGVWSSFESIKPLLEGKWIPEEVHRGRLGGTQGALPQLCQALKSAGMLYESSDDDGRHLSDVSRARFRPELASVELKSDGPLEAFAHIRTKRFVIAARSDLAVAIAGAALESGLCSLSLLCPDWTAKDNDLLQRIVQDHTVEPESPAVSAVNWEPALRQNPDCDGFMVAVALESDREVLNRALRLLLDPVKCGLVMYIGSSQVVTCVCDPHAGCHFCTAGILAEEPQSGVSLPVSELKHGIVVGARMLLRHFWDAQLDGPLSIAQHTMMELNLRNYGISRRARPPRTTCKERPTIAPTPLPPVELLSGRSSNAISKLEFCKRAEAICVDSDSGILRVLDEGDLLQYPRHQCAARLADSDAEPYPPWLTECGEEMVEARAGAVRRALERHYEGYFRRTSSHRRADLCCTSSGELESAPTTILFDDGVTVSGETWLELVEQGFFRALAKQALRRNAWIKTNVLLEIPPEQEVSLLSEHLKDIDAWKSVAVYEQVLSLSECSLLRFDHEGRTISVVAGPDRSLAWRIGLQDIWMDLAVRDAFASDGGSHRPAIRYRAACSSVGAKDPSNVTAKLELHLGLHLCLFPIAAGDSMKLLSLSFAHACFAQVSPPEFVDADEEKPASVAG